MTFNTSMPTEPNLSALESYSGAAMSRQHGHESLSVSQQFESMFLQMMIKQLRQAGSEEGLFPGDRTDTFGVMFDQFIADHLSQGGGLGLASYIEQNTSAEELSIANQQISRYRG